MDWLAAFWNAVLNDAVLDTSETLPAAFAHLPSADSAGQPTRQLQLSVCNLEARTVGAVWSDRLGATLIACALPPADTIRRVSISFEPLKGPLWDTGVVFAAPNLGLMLADSSIEEVQSALSSLYGYSAHPFLVRGMERARGNTMPEPGAVRSMGDSCPAGSVHWLSSITWDSRTHTAAILLPHEEHLTMTAPGSPWVAVLFRTDSWAAVAHTKPMSAPPVAPVAAPTLAPVPDISRYTARLAPLLGRCVRLVGLVGRPELNGEIAHAVAFDPPSFRYTARLANGGGVVRVREANLVEASEIDEQD